MSDIKFNCPNCGQHISIDEAGRGYQVDCPNCRKAITVPSTTGYCGESISATQERHEATGTGGAQATGTRPTASVSIPASPTEAKEKLKDLLSHISRGAAKWGSIGLTLGVIYSLPFLKTFFTDPSAFSIRAGSMAVGGVIVGAVLGLFKGLGAAATGTLGHADEAELPSILGRSLSGNRDERLLALAQIEKLLEAGKISDKDQKRLVLRAFARALSDCGTGEARIALGCIVAMAHEVLYADDPQAVHELVPALPNLLDTKKMDFSKLSSDDFFTVVNYTNGIIHRVAPPPLQPPIKELPPPTLAGAPGLDHLVQEVLIRMRQSDDIRGDAIGILANVGSSAAPACKELAAALAHGGKELQTAQNCIIALARIGPAAAEALPVLEALVPQNPDSLKTRWFGTRNELTFYAKLAIAQIKH